MVVSFIIESSTVLYIYPDRCWTRFDIHYFTLYLYQAINERHSFKESMLVVNLYAMMFHSHN